ncbi:hypothetical protein DNU06_07065 [Putridiphycobacter roseus]|uniref:Uncharacterized protein n=1 Tax=Putridiphycobacter roseus TaxID=2219161 RepID=A0A2W1NPM9_9FLAO|nr:hypothetical protein DNU06_07065 [Putridiphycobacter roseus]
MFMKIKNKKWIDLLKNTALLNSLPLIIFCLDLWFKFQWLNHLNMLQKYKYALLFFIISLVLYSLSIRISYQLDVAVSNRGHVILLCYLFAMPVLIGVYVYIAIITEIVSMVG